MEEFDDKQLIEKYIVGDEAAFTQLYEKYKRPLYSYLAKFLNQDRIIIDDIFQEAWIKVIKNIDNYKDKQNFLAWIIIIAKNLAFDKFRKASYKKEKVNFDESYIGSSTETPDKKMYKKELTIIINEEVMKLPEAQKEVYLLREQNVSFKDIAIIQEVSLNTALGRMHYVVKKLRPLLKKYLE